MTVSAITADTQDSPLLAAIVDRLRDKVPLFNKANCFETEQPVPPSSYFPQGDVACTVCLQDGQFDERLYDGGGPNQLSETLQLGVTVFRRSKIDQPPRVTVALQDCDKGVLKVLKLSVLRALLVEDLDADILVPWQPVSADGNPILRGMGLVPRSCQGPRALSDMDWIGLTIWFSVAIDWDLRLPEVLES